MHKLTVQLIHPGPQKPFNIGKGYFSHKNQIIREWNDDKGHYRKFLKSKGHFIEDVPNKNPNYSDLYLWGEWEGNSVFEKFNNGNSKLLPNGVHYPFHSTVIRGSQNTDPYIFGDAFKYCVCKQTGDLQKLTSGSLIIFGTVYPSANQFVVDTVFVVGNNKYGSSHIKSNNGAAYSSVYREETLEQLKEYLHPSYVPNKYQLYHGQSFYDNPTYFSFVPCKTDHNGSGFQRFFLKLDDPILNLSTNTTGRSYLPKCDLSQEMVWNKIVQEAKNQGFKLGIKFDEPSNSKSLNSLIPVSSNNLGKC